MITDAQKKAKQKYDKEHIRNIACSVRKEFADELDEFLKSDLGQKYENKSRFVAQAIREKMIADGYQFKE